MTGALRFLPLKIRLLDRPQWVGRRRQAGTASARSGQSFDARPTKCAKLIARQALSSRQPMIDVT